MSVSPHATAGVLLLLLTAATGGGAYVGAAVAREITEPGTREVLLSKPQSLATVPAWATRSEGGFTGFGDAPALRGVMLGGGTIVASDDGSLTVEAPGARMIVDYTETLRLFRIRPSLALPSAGDTVLVRLVAGVATGVLVVEIEPPTP